MRFLPLLMVLLIVDIAPGQDASAKLSVTSEQTTEQLLAPYRLAAEARWSRDIEAFDTLNESMSESADAILFIGSSSIRRWEAMSEDMVPYATIRRGYGGAKYTDMAVFARRIISPHRYRAIVMFVGNGVVGQSNDHTPDQIEELTRYIVEQSFDCQPDAPFFLVEITPCERRFHAWSKIRAVNARLREVALTTANTYFVPTASHYLKPDGTPRPELFVEDKLHLNQAGYKLWAKLIRRRLDDVLR